MQGDIQRAMSFLEARAPGQSLCFRCPGGRIGTHRFRAFLELFDDASNLTLMISRRQALTLRGPIGEVPDYLYRELNAEAITGPNVKSYPYATDASLQDYIVDRLGVLASETSGLTLSYSPDRLYRGNLRLDDFCLQRSDKGTFKLESNLWSTNPNVLLDDIDPENLPSLLNALEELITDYQSTDELLNQSLRTVRKNLLRIYNRGSAEIDEPFNGSDKDDDSDLLSERSFTGPGETGGFHETGDGTVWVILPVVAGILSRSLQQVLEIILDKYSIESMRLTPEQNILFPMEDRKEAEAMIEELEGVEIARGKHARFPRVATCPGAIFCSNVKTNPVQLTERLSDYLLRDDRLAAFNREHPIGITGCGETKDLERRHPIGVYPASEQRYRVSVGGNLHGEGNTGLELNEPVPASDLPTTIRNIVESFRNTSSENFQVWCRSSDFHLKK